MKDENMIVLLLLILGGMIFMVGLLINTWYVPMLATVMILAAVGFIVFQSYLQHPAGRRKSSIGKGSGLLKPKSPSPFSGGKPAGRKVPFDPFTKTK